MDYYLKEFTIQELYELVESNRIDLNPSYQRNFIWSPDNQKELIDTILREYPLPNFFFYKKPDGAFEMVDGQQRTKTIYRFIKGEITSSKLFDKKAFSQLNKDKFLKYRLPVVIIENLKDKDSLQEFYVLINKKGIHLNIAEMNKSEYNDTKFLKLANELLSYQNLIDLNLFSEASSKRMNDRAFVEELLGYLLKGVKEKKKTVEAVYKTDIDEDDYQHLDKEFKRVIDRISALNKIHPVSESRYKQKNDFYTLFCFVHENITEAIEVAEYQYRILILLDGTDSESRQFIRPSNDECLSLKEYANNCITQSNSKTAREKRMLFFENILKNTNHQSNDTLKDVLNYLASVFGDEKINLKKIGQYELIDLVNLQ